MIYGSKCCVLVTAIYLAMTGGILRADPVENNKPTDTCLQLIDAARRNDSGVIYDLTIESEQFLMVADAFARLGGRYDSNSEGFDPILLKYFDREAASEALKKLGQDATNNDRLRAIVSTIRNPRALVKECMDDAVRDNKLRGNEMPDIEIKPEELKIVITGDTAKATQGHSHISLKLVAGKWRVSGQWNLHRVFK